MLKSSNIYFKFFRLDKEIYFQTIFLAHLSNRARKLTVIISRLELRNRIHWKTKISCITISVQCAPAVIVVTHLLIRWALLGSLEPERQLVVKFRPFCRKSKRFVSVHSKNEFGLTAAKIWCSCCSHEIEIIRWSINGSNSKFIF